MMAGTSNLPYGEDRDSLPCAAPTPLPPPPSQGLTPDPEVVLTPEHHAAQRVSSGILRLHREGKLPRRQVHFSLECISDNSGAISLEPPEKTVEPPEVPRIRLERELSRVSTEDTTLPPPSPLAAPVPHSTLALGAEVQAAREKGFNARQAAEELVQRSFVTRCALEARVGEGMNIPRDQRLYQGLVSLQVPKEELVNSAVQEKLALVRHRPEGRQEPPCLGPDLLAFYNPKELFTETPFLEVEGLPPLKLQPRPRDPATTFFMYRKLHQWDS
ncbi:protein phosphatase 1 regulatory subunit 35 [Sceloporus undulatus]|uniref:protein phosphatase 1 regulatory subunit 35 n=1 Tax=Sceloporus undulatus TaxID=8520 RepID=UPI001C4C4BF9|nr:protein phosphatase 1 regulatory subunit 35 [Sceloporus undulatus]XP_042332312.1 protein phosphatase 1 regulatory subunit 35 [Sceloporus undulatus]XP_042332313.1 protein phosphatase 1 regulatory subunit 35 [Sceloporus undulatus]XP_042332314.1 protein phosphatase 1 regulatory subunit 35 [Sceloporus undulatus]